MLTRFLFLLIVSVSIVSGCSVQASKAGEIEKAATGRSTVIASGETAPAGATIKIEPNSPADTVRAFYTDLREKRFRKAIYLTNLRPAIEGLTDTELKEFQVDFERISLQIPTELQINGEIISGDSATVTAKLPGEDEDKLELQEIKLRKENGVWIILTVDEKAEKMIKKEGKNYFYQLRIETHQDEAREMLDRIAKAQMAFSLQNGNIYGDIPALIAAGFLPDDVQTGESTGYKYSVALSPDKKIYSASAVPSEYGKTGKLSFSVQIGPKGGAKLTSKDNGGKAF